MRRIETLRSELKAEGLGVVQYDDGPVHSYPYDAPWLLDETFCRLYDGIRHNTLVDRNRCYALHLLAAQAAKIPGDVLEVGAWRGGTAALLAATLPEKKVFIADTFEGVVKSADWEHYQDRAHDDTSIETVATLLGSLRLANYEILPGIFPEMTGDRVVDRTFALVHIDVDVYHSTKDAFAFIWDRMERFGIVVFDDYGFLSACPGSAKFLSEIAGDADKLFIQNMNGHVYIIKK